MRRLFTVMAAGLFIGTLASSCSKSLENKLTGSWKLDVATKRLTIGSSPFLTGYESGLFHLDDNGLATYIDGTDTLNGYWKAGKHNKGIYNNKDGTWQARDMHFMVISVSNSLLHRSLEWRFDDISLYNDNRSLRGEQYTLGYDRIYEFKKR